MTYEPTVGAILKHVGPEDGYLSGDRYWALEIKFTQVSTTTAQAVVIKCGKFWHRDRLSGVHNTSIGFYVGEILQLVKRSAGWTFEDSRKPWLSIIQSKNDDGEYRIEFH